jgi:type IV secretion system protein VirD4
MAPPYEKRPSWLWKIVGGFVLALLAHSILDPGGHDTLRWSVGALALGWFVKLVVQQISGLRIPIGRGRGEVADDFVELAPVWGEDLELTPAARARAKVRRLGGGAYLGVARGQWVTADPESAVGVIGPPRSGKTTALVIPAVMAASGAVISTSTKPDVMLATVAARSEIGQAWLFDPSGEETFLPDGVRRLNWSPVAAAASWDDAVVMAATMTTATRTGAGRGTSNEDHWTERAQALLAPLLFAARLSEQPVAAVLKWVLHQDLAPALEILGDGDSETAADVLIGIHRTDTRERSSIFSATAGVLAAYRLDAVRSSASDPNFDAMRFARSTDTIYVTSPEHKQHLCAPLIVGMLEQTRQAVYHLAARGETLAAVMQWFLDEFTNIAPIANPLGLISQAGGLMLQVVLGFQDIAQIRARYGDAVADAVLTLLQTIVLLAGIRDSRTLESVSLSLGEYDRKMVSHSLGLSEPQEWRSEDTHNDTVSYQTQRQRILTPGEIARPPRGLGLLLTGADWKPLGLTRFHQAEPWKTIAGGTAAARP